MKKITFLFLIFGMTMLGQTKTITGIVTDVNNEPIPGANIKVEGSDAGATSNFDGIFTIKVNEFPVKIIVSYLGYKTVERNVISEDKIKIVMEENNEFLDDVVISASRATEKIKESPVTIERINYIAIKRNAAPSFYIALANLKGVDINTNSLTFQSVNTRGFATFSNTRFLQLVDNAESTSPSLNFPLGNLVGLNELDVASVEILPGASSALYGANAFNGVLNMQSKNPFTFKGLSTYVKYGVTTQEAAGTNPYSDVGIRYAFGSDYVAAKINFAYMKGTDWVANDITDIDFNAQYGNAQTGTRESNPSYDGMNIYGDEIVSTLPLHNETGGQINDITVSRTGYAETDLNDYNARNIKGDIGLFYRPSGKSGKLEISLKSNFGTGKTIYQGSNRYVLDDFIIYQHRVEIKNKNFYVRGYYTGEDAGNSYDTKFTAWNINRKWRNDKDWFYDYETKYIEAKQNGEDDITAHNMAREFADNSPIDANGNPKTPRYMPGTKEYEKAFNEVINDPDPKTGGKFVDKTNLKHGEFGYNFKNLIKVADIQVGASLRRYSLHSEGTIFTDYKNLDEIHIDEMGAYMQVTKKLFDKKLKLSTSLRYDQQKNFDGNFSPRFSMVYSTGQNKKHNFRFSYQTGFRNPSTQELYIGYNVGIITLLGAAPDNPERYSEELLSSTYSGGATITGIDAYTNAYTLESFMAFAQAAQSGTPLPDAAKLLEIADVKPIVPEQVKTMEFGYRGKIAKHLGMDFSVYLNNYENFGASTYVMALASEVGNVHDSSAATAIGTNSFKPFALYTNTDQKIKSYGLDISLNYKLKNYRIDFVYDYAGLDFDQEKDPDFRTGFNTPEHRIKISLGNDRFYKNLGFKINYKYQTEYKWEASFADGMVPERNLFDAQVTYNIKKLNTKVKLGGSNILGKEYLPATGTGKVGSIYYISLTYNN